MYIYWTSSLFFFFFSCSSLLSFSFYSIFLASFSACTRLPTDWTLKCTASTCDWVTQSRQPRKREREIFQIRSKARNSSLGTKALPRSFA